MRGTRIGPALVALFCILAAMGVAYLICSLAANLTFLALTEGLSPDAVVLGGVFLYTSVFTLNDVLWYLKLHGILED